MNEKRECVISSPYLVVVQNLHRDGFVYVAKNKMWQRTEAESSPTLCLQIKLNAYLYQLFTALRFITAD